MDSNNLISAPQINGVDRVFKIWEESLYGSMGDRDGFYRFMTVPSSERSEFIDLLQLNLKFDNSVLLSTINSLDYES